MNEGSADFSLRQSATAQKPIADDELETVRVNTVRPFILNLKCQTMISVKKTTESKTDNRNRMDLCIGNTTLRLTEREAVYLVRQIADLYFGDVNNLEANIRNHKGFEGKDLGKILDPKEKK